MKKVLIFGGTSETHELLRTLSVFNCTVTLCVASDYALILLPDNAPSLSVLVGRLNTEEIGTLLQSGGYTLVVDATHPYATQVTKNIKAATTESGIPCFRLLRERSNVCGVTIVATATDAAELLTNAPGNVLLTTGSKDLAAFTAVPDYANRIYPRILPSIQSLEACLSNGYQANRIIALHGPFSKELNIALMRQFDIKTVITKESGKPGGFQEKLEAVQELGAEVIVIERPADSGLTQQELCETFSTLLEVK